MNRREFMTAALVAIPSIALFPLPKLRAATPKNELLWTFRSVGFLPEKGNTVNEVMFRNRYSTPDMSCRKWRFELHNTPYYMNHNAGWPEDYIQRLRRTKMKEYKQELKLHWSKGMSNIGPFDTPRYWLFENLWSLDPKSNEGWVNTLNCCIAHGTVEDSMYWTIHACMPRTATLPEGWVLLKG
jgi:hypothetical protein